ncbi:non-specific lipid transfer protein GPI-anchored 5 [Quercus suber]|uniref:non-specific lipid transfer protein GPI-anchored 5 n=1 Tax=Quercus suber TaxID=58331 RepID=UPI000CE2043D|nr:non-specific lipid-transfer protein-like protein At2g13820 [Quercus suber]XP_023874965.1 non-specific lipid-transfer protein-like protein At2g13820 [Quercus suber]XP_023908309.1 non-specific lipid-transfer protein-like protein At2g13820 [Quercus suber]POE82973.1 non-specific lipid transfer protein gpi-anchored 2 [Quercus suber]POF15967.1 non-specific lipid transfer protein gpi-anchored 2 [Quercus suber]
MALRGIDIGLALILVSMLWVRAAAQSGCNSVLIGMAPCLNYVTGSSSTPSSSCCSQLASVVKSQPQCLCTVLNGGGASLGVTINQTLALGLPAACNVQTPPVSKCNAANGPTTSPVGSPVGSPEGSPSDSSTSSSTSGAGSKTVPSTATTGTSSSNGSIIEMPLQLIFLFIFLAAYGSTCSSF